MAKSFGDTSGTAKKREINYYKFKDGVNNIRMFGDVVARYGYFHQMNGVTVFIECLSFDREQERFTNMERDPYAEAFPDKKPQWSYVTLGADLDAKECFIIAWKKKVYQDIVETAKDLGDPTSLDEGWNIVINRVKTGPAVMNVDYNLMPLRCKKLPIPADLLEKITALKSIEEYVPRPTVEEVQALVDNITSGKIGKQAEKSKEEAPAKTVTPDADFDDDIPF